MRLFKHGRILMTVRLLVLFCLVSVPVLGQSRTYTNADLGKPIVHTRTVTLEELRSLAAHQYTAPPSYPSQPEVIVIAADPNWPFTPQQAQDYHDALHR